MKIAMAEEGDLPQLIALWQACGLTRPWNDPEKDLRFALASPTSTVLLGKEDNEVVTSVMVGHDGHRGALYYLAVSPSHQGKGHGRAIHEAAVDWLRRHGVWKINLLVRGDNAQVQGYYQALGYQTNDVISFGKRIDQ